MTRRSSSARISIDQVGRLPARVRTQVEEQLAARPPADPARGRPWSAARPTQVAWDDGRTVTLPSRTEARVALRLLEEVAATPGARLYRQVRVPLLAIASRPGGTPYVLTVDFVVVLPDGRRRYIDAKTRRRSPEWARGRAAAEAWLGQRIEETSA